MSFWGTVRYGFNPVYYVTVSGIPVVWIERATGLTLPTGFSTEDASLVIDDSSEIGVEMIDRQRGVAASLSFGFKLLDTSTVRDWLRRWSRSAILTADLSAIGTTITVDSTAGWPATGELQLGIERITYTGTTATTFTGCSRAQSGSLVYKHATGTTAQFATDRPRHWRGREVVLWAAPADPSGYVPGATLYSDARMVWRGRIVDGPQRERDGFRFEAQSLDRVLDDSLVATISGQVVDTSAKYLAQKGWGAMVFVDALDSTGASLWTYELWLSPFENDADGDMMSGQTMRERIVDAWAAAVTEAGAGADLLDLVWSKIKGGFWQARACVVQDVNIHKLLFWVYHGGEEWVDSKDPTYPGGMQSDRWELLPWVTGDDPTTLLSYPFATAPKVSSVTLALDSGAASDVPASGKVRISVGEASIVYSYTVAGSSQGQVYLAGLTPILEGKAVAFTAAQLVGSSAEIVFEDSGEFAAMMLRTLFSSGTGLRSATYDTLKRGQGYGLAEDQIHQWSFEYSTAPLSTIAGAASHGGKTFAELFGGALGLFRKAVVARPDVDDGFFAPKLHLVDTASFGADYATTIHDDDLLSNEGDPVLSVRRADSPNRIVITRPIPGSDDAADRWTFADHSSADATGSREATYDIPAQDRAALWIAAEPAAAMHLAADETTQAVELRVPPWIDAEVGDLVRLELTHPAMWTWGSNPGAVGYTGTARVVGRRLNLKTCQVTLLLLFDGAVTMRALSPAARVQSFAGAAANPTSIDVDLKYLNHFTNAIAAAGGNVWVYHYQPGQVETVTQKHEISGASNVGGNCRLTVASTSGGHSLSTADRSTLTLPTTNGGDLSTFQAGFAHVDDGTQWG